MTGTESQAGPRRQFRGPLWPFHTETQRRERERPGTVSERQYLRLGVVGTCTRCLCAGRSRKGPPSLPQSPKNNYGVFEAFGQRLWGRTKIRIMSNHDAPAFIQEFMFRTQPFWKAHPEAKRFFTSICLDPYVQVRVEDFHQHKTQGIGLALQPVEFQVEHHKRSEELKNALDQAVLSASRNARLWP